MKKPRTLQEFRGGASSDTLTPVDVIARIFDRIDRERRDRPGTHDGPEGPEGPEGGAGAYSVWIAFADRARTLERVARLDYRLPLAGVPFAVKDNIDVEGLPTTAGCPAFVYKATRTAPVVQRLLDAGAVLIGKTNMDQFATGLVGIRSPYGECGSAADPAYIAGGSSSGSALAVALGYCAFSLGTDTAGSGRVPAAFNGLVGLKPTRGLLSTTGVVPACRSLDCVSIFASTAADAEVVWRVAMGVDPEDPYSRALEDLSSCASVPDSPFGGGATFRFGTPSPELLEFFGDTAAAALFEGAASRLASIGGVRTTIDYRPFLDAAMLLYGGPWVAERTAAVGEFVARHPGDVHPVVREIVLGGARASAVDAFRGLYRLAELRAAAAAEWRKMDVLLLPTTGTIYTRAAVRLDPIRLNTNLGYYTNFVNLLDLAAVAVPAGVRPNRLPFGVSLVGPAGTDTSLLRLAGRYLGEALDPATATPAGDAGHERRVQVAVVGAHLTGEPLNHQLVERDARLVACTRTAPEYRLFALAHTQPAKPGLVRDPAASGAGIEVEVWSMPEDGFGSFVAAVPPPLCIGTIRLASGEWVKGFLCEPVALADAADITAFGGWRAYRAAARP